MERFSEEEWRLLGTLPPMIGAVMAGVGSSGLGTVKEAFASMRAVLGGGRRYPDNALITGLTARATSLEEARKRASGNYRAVRARLEQHGIETPEQLRSYLLEECRRANRILAEKTSPQEAREYREWVMYVAEKVAAAAREGGFLGFHGERISKEERKLLEELREALAPRSS